MTMQTRVSTGRENLLTSQQGSVLIIVIVLSTIALAVMTTVLYVIMMGSQITGMEKRYRTAHDAALGGSEIVKQLIGLRGNTVNTNSFEASLAATNVIVSTNTSTACQGTVSGGTESGWAAKILTPSTTWTGCDVSSTIDPSNATSYDKSIALGATGNRYTVYVKIIRSTTGNTTGDSGQLWLGGVVTSNADVQVTPMPFLYTVEIHAQSVVNPLERAKFSLVYQY